MSKAEMLREALRRVLAEHERTEMLPTSGRFLFYELIAKGVIAKSIAEAKHSGKGRRPDQDPIDALTNLRQSGEIPWDWIIDETRSLDNFSGSETIADELLAYLYAARIDPWDGAVPLILTESRSLAGVLRETTRDYATLIAATNGQANGFLRTKVAPGINKNTRVLYLGDWDFSGGHIEANSRRILESYYPNLEWERLALTEEQVRTEGLTVIQKYDKRTKQYHPAVETEALSQQKIIEIVRDKLDELLPAPLDEFRAREETERERLRALLTRRRR
jgi:hypothetical protein